MSNLSSGRFPWYNSKGKPLKPYIIGIAGGSASGKTSVSTHIIESLGVPWVALLCMDSFYKVLSPEQSEAAKKNAYNFDHPHAFDFDLIYETLVNLKQGIRVNVPIYDFCTHSRLPVTKTLYGANVIIFEGIFALYDSKLRDLMDLKIFVDTDADIRLARRLKRDISERARKVEGVLTLYNRFVKPCFDQFIYPTMSHADVILPRGLDNSVAMNLMINHVLCQLDDRGFPLMTEIHCMKWETEPLPETVYLLPQKPYLINLLTCIKDKESSREDIIFSINCLSRILLEFSVSLLPHQCIQILTPTNNIFDGNEFNAPICAVSIVRAGASMERSLKKIFKDIPIGKILIQTDPSIGEPQLHYCKLPSDIDQRFVLLNDAQIKTGAAALMAIRVLLDHHVKQESIILSCHLSFKRGIHLIHSAFPKVRIVSCNMEHDINGISTYGYNFGDRYFGTGEY